MRFSDGVSLTLSQYNEYLEQQNAWIDSLPEITPEDDELYDYWISLQDEVAKENGGRMTTQASKRPCRQTEASHLSFRGKESFDFTHFPSWYNQNGDMLSAYHP